MISVRGVVKSFGRVRAVSGVSFEVGGGQVVGLLGANGAGKTTTIRMITGYLPPDEGSVAVAGHDTVNDSLGARRSVGYLPESAPVYGEMSVDGFLHFRGRLYGLARPKRREAVDRVLERCDLREVRRRRVGHLSKGFRQRVGLAAAMLHDPPVLVLDEPTNGLDPRQIGQARRLIRELAEDRTVLVSSHILPEVEQTCDRVIIMARGRVRVDAEPSELLDSLREAAPYVVEASGEGVDAAMSAVPGVARVEPMEVGANRWVSYRLHAAPSAGDLREAIARTAQQRGVLIRELRRETPGLERVFLQLIDTDEQERTEGHHLPGQAPPPARAPETIG